jgi:RNA polymerase sigma-70 factor (family 1)
VNGKINGDDEALEAILQGSEEGLRHYFSRHYASLTNFAFRLLNDQFLAEEFAAEAFVKLWNRREQFSSDGSVKAWLHTTVRNASFDHLRRAKLIRVSEMSLQTPETIEQSALHHMIESETVQQVIRVLELLPPKCRQVFKMFYFGGKSYEEIARKLNLSPHTVRNQHIRAVRLLKEKVN